MLKIIVAVIIITISFLFFVEAQRNVHIDEIVLEKAKLNPTDTQRVIILFSEKPSGYRNAIKNLGGKIKHDYTIINGIAVEIPNVAIEGLKNIPNVISIKEDRIMRTFLDESIPLINATQVHQLGYKGKNRTICIIDTGIDYKHPSIGGADCNITTSVIGNTSSELVESPHPYSNNYDFTWTITKPGFKEIAVHFSNISVEKNFDFVYVKDASGNIIQAFTGTYNNIWSVSVPGDTIKINLVSDFSITGYGFVIDMVLNGSVSSTWNNCGRVIDGFDFVNEDNNPIDDHGHGTHVAGIAASNDTTYTGVAPEAFLNAVKVLDSSGNGFESDVIAGINWCSNRNADVISMSLGGGLFSSTCDSESDAQAVNNAFASGSFVAVASGNDGSTTSMSAPACASNATSVGATYDANVGRKRWGTPTICTDSTTSADKIVCFTNRNQFLDLLAPGSIITSTKLGGGFTDASGTSMSTPHVGGAGAVLLSANKGLTPKNIQDVLKQTGKPIFDSNTGLTFSRIDLLKAVQNVTAQIISITLEGFPVQFGSLDGGTINSSAFGNVNNSYIIKVNPETTMNVDLYIKGNDFLSGSEVLGIGNMTWNTVNDVNTSKITKNIFSSPAIAINVTPGTNVTTYHWISIPQNKLSGTYNATIFVKAVVAGDTP